VRDWQPPPILGAIPVGGRLFVNRTGVGDTTAARLMAMPRSNAGCRHGMDEGLLVETLGTRGWC
jgi:hypothetical protein